MIGWQCSAHSVRTEAAALESELESVSESALESVLESVLELVSVSVWDYRYHTLEIEKIRSSCAS